MLLPLLAALMHRSTWLGRGLPFRCGLLQVALGVPTDCSVIFWIFGVSSLVLTS